MEINPHELNTLSFKREFEPNKPLFLALARKISKDFVYNTSALEGNPMTYPEVETLLDGITVGGHKLSDQAMILNQNKALNLLFELVASDKFALDKETICKLHSKVSFEEALLWGEFRDASVGISGTEYKPPKPADLDKIFVENIALISGINEPAIRAFVLFLFCARTQFFYDGNKRTARLMMSGTLLSSGYSILNIKAKDRLEFNKQMISFYGSGDYAEATNYLIRYYEKEMV